MFLALKLIFDVDILAFLVRFWFGLLFQKVGHFLFSGHSDDLV
jgi:hypothetical protein